MFCVQPFFVDRWSDPLQLSLSCYSPWGILLAAHREDTPQSQNLPVVSPTREPPYGLLYKAVLMSQACCPNVFSHYGVRVKALGDIFHKDEGTNSCSPDTDSRAQNRESGTISATETSKDEYLEVKCI